MINSFVFSPFYENTYVIADASGEAVVIDPGCFSQAEKEKLAQYIDDNNLTVRHILLTHAHLDHVFGIAFLKRRYGPGLEAWLHRNDRIVYEEVPTRCLQFGLPGYEHSNIDHELTEGQIITVGNTTLAVRFVPGHAPGHVAFVNDAERYVVGGDVLFRESIGRTDFPYCDHADLLHSIQTQFFTLPDDYTVYAGHNQPTTIGHEKQHNPFLNYEL
jgi:hydroxyacylglutathione hydrolase